jgi:hypothetical protein
MSRSPSFGGRQVFVGSGIQVVHVDVAAVYVIAFAGDLDAANRERQVLVRSGFGRLDFDVAAVDVIALVANALRSRIAGHFAILPPQPFRPA